MPVVNRLEVATMAMRKKSKITSWKYDGRRGRRLSKRLANVHERRDARKEIRGD